MPRIFQRYVAMGDSTTEGLDDPDGEGGFRGWANRFAELIATHQGELLYANLAVRGLKTHQILETQLDVALAMRPDLATVVSGTNDVLRPKFDIAGFRLDVHHMQKALVESGATVLTFTLPDLSKVTPGARWVRQRILNMNRAVREVAQETGAIVVDLAMHNVAADRRLWSRDRLHANSLGHARIAAALAEAVGLPGSSNSWSEALGPDARRPVKARVAEELQWTREYLKPWLVRRIQGTSSADGMVCKRPQLAPVIVTRSERPANL